MVAQTSLAKPCLVSPNRDTKPGVGCSLAMGAMGEVGLLRRRGEEERRGGEEEWGGVRRSEE